MKLLKRKDAKMAKVMQRSLLPVLGASSRLRA